MSMNRLVPIGQQRNFLLVKFVHVFILFSLIVSLSGVAYARGPAGKANDVLPARLPDDETFYSPVPPLPSSFWGALHVLDAAPEVGDTLEAYLPGETGPIGTASVTELSGNLVYAINVPAGSKSDATEGDTVSFKLAGRVMATSIWHSGTNVGLDFHPPQAIPGGPYSDFEDRMINFNAYANDYGGDITSFDWDWDNDGIFDETGQTPGHLWLDPGTYTVVLRVTDAQGGQGVADFQVVIIDDNTPPLPSSFWGEIHIYDDAPQPGDVVEVYFLGISEIAASTTIRDESGRLVYSLNVPAGDQGLLAEGDTLIFRINGRVVAETAWHSGTNVELNIHPPQALPGGPYIGAVNTAVSFTGSANDWGADISSYQWDWEDDGTYDAAGAAQSYTWTALGSYTVRLKVTDAQGGESTATTTVNIYQKYSLPLVPGWNLVSFPLQPVDSAVASVLADISGEYSMVFAWDATGAHAGGGHWMSYDPSMPVFLNTLSSLDQKMGFWIYMTVADTLDVKGTTPATTNIPLLTGAGGWNLVGYPSASAGTMPTILGSANFTLAQSYHAADTADLWKIWDTTIPFPELNDLTTLTNGWGYWVYMNSPYSWDVSY